MWLSGSQGILYIFLQRKRLHIRLYVYAGVLQKHSLMVTASMAGLMMPVSSMAVLAGLCATGNAAGIMGMIAHVCTTGNAAGIMGMAAHVRATGNAAGIMGMAAHVCTTGNTAGVMGMIAHVCATGNAAGVMGMAAHVRASCYAAVVISMSVIRRVGIAVLAVVHVGGCFGTSRNVAGAVAVFTGLCTAVDAAKPVCVCGFQSASRYAAVMIPMSVIRRVGIAVLAVVHVSGCFGTTRNAAGTVAVFAGLCTSVNAAKSVCVCGFQSAACYIAVMIPMSVIGGGGIAVLTVVHVSGCFGTTRNAADAVAVFTGLCTAVDTAKSVLVYFRLCTTCHFAGNACSIFLCRPLDFRGTLIYRIGDNTACHHGNGYKRNG